jgi:hypothetical protein
MHRWTFNKQPIAYQTAAFAVLNVFIIAGVVRMTPDLVAAVNVAATAILAVVVQQAVTPVVAPRDHQGNKLTPEGT